MSTDRELSLDELLDRCEFEHSPTGDVAVYDSDRRYRYVLTREVSVDNTGRLGVVMLNPSTADAFKNDPTISRICHFTRLWGYRRAIIGNLFALRSPHPRDLKTERPVGPLNNAWLRWLLFRSHRVLVGWGRDPIAREQAAWFRRLAGEWGVELSCLGETADGSPKHPMARGRHRVPDNQHPQVWLAACYCVTGGGHVWCPTHGDCTGCDRPGMIWDPACPLHGVDARETKF